MIRLVLYVVVVVFALITIIMTLLNYGSPEFAPALSAAYSGNFWPRLAASLNVGAEQAIEIMFGSAAWIVHAIAVIVRFAAGIVAAIIDFFSSSRPVSRAPAPPPPPVALPLPAPVPPPLPAAAPAVVASGFFPSFFSACLNGFVFVLAVRTLLYAGGWYLDAYKVQWPGGPYSRSLPVLDYRDDGARVGLYFLQFICLIGGILLLSGGALPGYFGVILGFFSGAALPIVPHSIFFGLRLFNIAPARARAIRD
jgi:hypothetical protein